MVTMLAIFSTSVAVEACGQGRQPFDPHGRGRSNSSASMQAGIKPPASPYWKSDGDSDADEQAAVNSRNDDDLEVFSTAPNKAARADARAIAKVVKSYFLAAVSSDGSSGCMLLASRIAAALGTESGGRAQPAINSCDSGLTALFRQQHKHLIDENVATMVVTDVHVHGTTGVATLGFGSAPESDVILERESHGWKLDSLFDSILP
jgi:hypothetical protein